MEAFHSHLWELDYRYIVNIWAWYLLLWSRTLNGFSIALIVQNYSAPKLLIYKTVKGAIRKDSLTLPLHPTLWAPDKNWNLKKFRHKCSEISLPLYEIYEIWNEILEKFIFQEANLYSKQLNHSTSWTQSHKMNSAFWELTITWKKDTSLISTSNRLFYGLVFQWPHWYRAKLFSEIILLKLDILRTSKVRFMIY